MAADTFIYTPLNVGLFFALMTVVEGGRWTVRPGKSECIVALWRKACINLQAIAMQYVTSLLKVEGGHLPAWECTCCLPVVRTLRLRKHNDQQVQAW